MAEIEYVKEIDDLIPINTVFATATDKSGLVDNINKKTGKIMPGIPENGIIGVLFEENPDALVVSTGGTAKLIDKAGLKVMPIGDFTGWPEMDTGLVKSMQAKLYVGMLAHKYTASDDAGHTLEDKANGAAGITGTHAMGPAAAHLLQAYSVSANTIAKMFAENPGIFWERFTGEKVGKIEKGYKANFTVLNVNKPLLMTDEVFTPKCGWNPWHGFEFAGQLKATIVDGDKMR